VLETEVARRLAQGSRRIVLIGAGGWLGLATLELLHQALGEVFARRVVCFGSAARELELRGGLTVAQQSLSALAQLPAKPSIVLHFAFLTKDRAEAMDEDAYRAANRAISQTVLAALDRIGAEAVFVASSGAAAKAHDRAASAAMRLYGELKLADEAAFAQWAEESGRRAVIGRIYNITGPYINKHAAYAIASFILDALARRVISVRAPRRVVRANVAIRELMSLVLALLDQHESGVVRFDSGGEPQELEPIAQAVSDNLRGVGVHRAAITEAQDDLYFGDGSAYAALLREHGIASVPLSAQIAETAEYISSLQP